MGENKPVGDGNSVAPALSMVATNTKNNELEGCIFRTQPSEFRILNSKFSLGIWEALGEPNPRKDRPYKFLS